MDFDGVAIDDVGRADDITDYVIGTARLGKGKSTQHQNAEDENCHGLAFMQLLSAGHHGASPQDVDEFSNHAMICLFEGLINVLTIPACARVICV